MRLLPRTSLVATMALATLAASDHATASAASDAIALTIRTRVETAPKSGRYHAITKSVQWSPKETAIVVCDMWDRHWCQGAEARVAEMAPRMNEVLVAARKRGMLIVHCPSSCMQPYEGTPARKLAQQAPKVDAKQPLQPWCKLDSAREAPLPIDDRDGGCDCQPTCKHGAPWTRQIATLGIEPQDAVTDSAEAYYLMRQRGIKNVIVMGVHANMCVLGRPFSIRQLSYQGLNVVLMRDLTDTMYNSRSKPFVSHFTGTDLVVEHIETYWCPTITSRDFTGKPEFRFAADRRPHLVIVSAEDEYQTEQTLPEFARGELGKDYRVSLVFGSERDKNDLPGVEVLREADVALLSLRRRVLSKEQLQVFRDHAQAGKPIVGIRTASHGFSPRGDAAVPPGHAAWPEFDRDVLGGNYTGHHGKPRGDGPAALVKLVPEQARHPILAGVPTEEFGTSSWLYKVSPLAKSATPLMIGRVPGQSQPEPVAWTNAHRGGRVFYTSLGHPDDFKLPAFRKLLKNGIDWAARRESPSAAQ